MIDEYGVSIKQKRKEENKRNTMLLSFTVSIFICMNFRLIFSKYIIFNKYKLIINNLEFWIFRYFPKIYNPNYFRIRKTTFDDYFWSNSVAIKISHSSDNLTARTSRRLLLKIIRLTQCRIIASKATFSLHNLQAFVSTKWFYQRQI